MANLSQQMNRKAFVIIAFVVLAFSAPMLCFALQPGVGAEQMRRMHGDFGWYYTVKAVLSAINVALLVILLVIYLGVYWDTRSEFALGLVIFTLAMMMYAITSNPLMQMAFGFTASGLGPFAFFPDLFALIALLILLLNALRYR